MQIDSQGVADAHNAMSEEYDQLEDLWYSYLFNRIHSFIISNLPLKTGGKVLDIGCGTGFQSFLLAQAGYEACGFDIAEKLIAIAENKVKSNRYLKPIIFSSTLKQAIKQQDSILEKAIKLRGSRPIIAPIFRIGDAIDGANYLPNYYNIIVCCGSVLSFIDNNSKAIELMSKSLKDGGLLFLEVEQKVTLDLIWAVIDGVTKGRLGYDNTFGEAIDDLFSKPGENIRLDYPFELSDGTELTLPIWVFSIGYLKRLFDSNGLKITAKEGIHAITNFIPSTVLHKQRPNKSLQKVFSMLSGIENSTARIWPIWRLGCSVMYCLRKK